MVISKELLDKFIEQAQQEHAQFIARANACEGAIHAMQQLKIVLEQPEPVEKVVGPILVPDAPN